MSLPGLPYNCAIHCRRFNVVHNMVGIVEKKWNFQFYIK